MVPNRYREVSHRFETMLVASNEAHETLEYLKRY